MRSNARQRRGTRNESTRSPPVDPGTSRAHKSIVNGPRAVCDGHSGEWEGRFTATQSRQGIESMPKPPSAGIGKASCPAYCVKRAPQLVQPFRGDATEGLLAICMHATKPQGQESMSDDEHPSARGQLSLPDRLRLGQQPAGRIRLQRPRQSPQKRCKYLHTSPSPPAHHQYVDREDRVL
jgi:hypothetical protein